MTNQRVYVEGSQKGYDAYRLYLSVDLHFRGKAKGIYIKGGELTPRISMCKKSTYSSSPFLRFFEKLGNSFSQKEQAMLFVHYQIRPDRDQIYINNYNSNDLERYKAHIRRLEYDVSKELRTIFHDLKNNGSDIFNGSPSRLTKMCFSGQLSLEARIYLGLLVDVPDSDDMITRSVNELVEKYEPWFLYFSDQPKEYHENSARDMLQNFKSEL